MKSFALLVINVSGIQKDKIIDENEIARVIHHSIKEAEEEAGLKINSAYLTIPGKYVTIVQNSISKEAKDKYAGISAKDVTSSIMQKILTFQKINKL